MYGLSTSTLRCGWGVCSASFDETGQVKISAELHGPFAGWHQEVNRAEMYAFLMYLTHAVPYDNKYTFYSDSAFLVDGWLKPKTQLVSGWSLHADIWRKIFAVAEDLGIEHIELFKVAAHRSIRSATDMFDSLKILSNGKADELAKEGAARHPKNMNLYNNIAKLKLLVVMNAKYIVRCLMQHREQFEQETLARVPTQTRAAPDAGAVFSHKHLFF